MDDRRCRSGFIMQAERVDVIVRGADECADEVGVVVSTDEQK